MHLEFFLLSFERKTIDVYNYRPETLDNVWQNSRFDLSTFVSGSNSSVNYEIGQSSPQAFYLVSISSLVLFGMPT
jgi:hypothetical protein